MKLIHADANEKTLKIFTTWVLGIWFLNILRYPIVDLVDLPVASLYFMNFALRAIPESFKELFLTYPGLVIFKTLILLSLAARIFNLFPKTTGLIAAFLITAHQSFVRMAYMNHSELAILYALYAIVLADFAKAFTKGEEGKFNFNGAPLIAAMLFFTVTYVLIAVRRVVTSGVDIYFSDTMLHYLVDNAYSWGGSLQHKLTYQFLSNPFLTFMLKAGFPLVTIMELAAPFCLISRKMRIIFLIVMIPFHLLTYFSMNILFWHNMCLYILFIDITGLLNKSKKN